MKYLSLFLVILLLLVGCSTKYSVNPVDSEISAKLEAGQKAYVALAPDGRYSDKIYPGSGMQVSSYVAQALTPYTSFSQINNQALSLPELLQQASSSGARYLFVPIITHWEPRAAAWSGIPTRLNIEMTAYDVEVGKPIASNSVSVRGKIATFVSQHASELAEQAVIDLVASFFK